MFFYSQSNNVEDLKKRHPQFGKVTKQHVNPSSSHYKSSTQSTAVVCFDSKYFNAVIMLSIYLFTSVCKVLWL